MISIKPIKRHYHLISKNKDLRPLIRALDLLHSGFKVKVQIPDDSIQDSYGYLQSHFIPYSEFKCYEKYLFNFNKNNEIAYFVNSMITTKKRTFQIFLSNSHEQLQKEIRKKIGHFDNLGPEFNAEVLDNSTSNYSLRDLFIKELYSIPEEKLDILEHYCSFNNHTSIFENKITSDIAFSNVYFDFFKAKKILVKQLEKLGAKIYFKKIKNKPTPKYQALKIPINVESFHYKVFGPCKFIILNPDKFACDNPANILYLSDENTGYYFHLKPYEEIQYPKKDFTQACFSIKNEAFLCLEYPKEFHYDYWY